jgi:hypothetical protein
LVASDLTGEQIAEHMTSVTGSPVTLASLKHTIGRIMTKLHVSPRTRAALVRFILEETDGAE